jgi:hypothetical protein
LKRSYPTPASTACDLSAVSQVWAMDVSCILMAKGCIYPGVVLDWSSRPVLSRRVSITMEAACFIGALEEALLCHGKPEIFNTDDARCRRWRRSSRCSCATAPITGIAGRQGHGPSDEGQPADRPAEARDLISA